MTYYYYLYLFKPCGKYVPPVIIKGLFTHSHVLQGAHVQTFAWLVYTDLTESPLDGPLPFSPHSIECMPFANTQSNSGVCSLFKGRIICFMAHAARSVVCKGRRRWYFQAFLFVRVVTGGGGLSIWRVNSDVYNVENDCVLLTVKPSDTCLHGRTNASCPVSVYYGCAIYCMFLLA